MIGAGWYGKCDLLQLMNVEPVEVVSLCDVDSNMLSEAADLMFEYMSPLRDEHGAVERADGNRIEVRERLR